MTREIREAILALAINLAGILNKNCEFPERSEWELKFLRDAVDLVFDELVDL